MIFSPWLTNNGTNTIAPVSTVAGFVAPVAVSPFTPGSVAIISSYYKATGKDMNTALDLINKWNTEKTAMPLSDHEVFRTVQSIYSSDMQFGCSAIKNLDLCSEEYCKFKK